MFYVFSLFYLTLSVVYFLSFFLLFFSGGYLFDFFLFSLFGFDFSFSFVVDFVSLGFAGCVAIISGVVFLYSVYYMAGILDNRRFGYLVFLFVVSMFFLVFSGNFFTTMIGWDGLGLTSFCLVIFYGNSVSLDSGLITVFSNRVGDVFFLLSFFLFVEGGLWSFDGFFTSVPLCLLLFLFFGSITKSAQVPFSAWLPAAMAAPTPVSSLVHSSTLVTAGVYVLIRYHYVFCCVGWSLAFFSLCTMILAGLCALVESDFKKIIAMSTLSQLGMMLFILSMGNWVLSFLHMVIHAFFKSTLFLSSGMLIGQLGGTQDSRFYGGFGSSSVSYVYFLVSCFSLAGFPFFVGFYSKDCIISYFSGFVGGLSSFVFFVGCVITVGYSVRLLVSGFVSSYKWAPSVSMHESSHFVFPVFILFFICVFGGSLLSWFFLSGVSLFLRGVDFLFGLLFIVLGVILHFLFKVSYHVLGFLGSISFLRWLSSGGVSSSFRGFVFYRGESSWMEMMGGGGLFSFLTSVSSVFDSVFNLSLKGVMALSFLLSFSFYV